MKGTDVSKTQGNYWNDYVGVDNNLDGVGDTPYLINANNIDRYPLMYPFDIDGFNIELPSGRLLFSIHNQLPLQNPYQN